jgi:hypothetical protein
MATKDEIETAIRVVREVSGDPVVGAIAELLKDLEASAVAPKDVRTVTPKETR